MEIILAIAVVTAVIFFGALISIGNEHQSRAIDNLHEQLSLWAVQDLKLKRERLAHKPNVENPFEWFNQIATTVYGVDLNLQFVEQFDSPNCLVFSSKTSGKKFLFSTLSQREVFSLMNIKKGRLSQFAEQNPLVFLPRGTKTYQLSVLNCGILFDLELSLAWKGISGKPISNGSTLWSYQLP